MKKIISIASSLLLAIIMIVTSMMNVNAASETISIGQARKVGHGYIAGVTFSYKVTTNGRYLYCLDLHKDTASNVKAKLVSKNSYVDGGLLYILKNGYPEKSITGDSDKDYYITQTAVWWYLDSVKGMGNLGNGFKSTGSDSYGLRKHVKKLVEGGIAHKNDSVNPSAPTLSLTVSNNSFYLKNGYYYSNAIKAKAEKVGSYKVTLGKTLPNTTIILDGKEFKYTGAFNVGVNSSFQIKVPAASIQDTSYTIPVSATATGNAEYRAYEYQPVNTKMQNVVLLEKSTRNVSTSLNLKVASSRVAITKIDAETKKALAGAVLTLKDANGKAIDTWTTTTSAHYVRNLADGVYTVEETKAPNGYILNKQSVKVTINSGNRDVKVSFENSKSGKLTITKIDSDTKKAVAGAVLVLKDSTGKVIDTWTTTEQAHEVINLLPGVYTVEETKAPNGYVLSKQSVKVNINSTNNRDVKVLFENSKSGKLIITKIDSDTKEAIAGAVLVLKDSTGKVIDTWTTTEQGHAVSNLTPGVYTVEETKAPNGYTLSKEVVKVNVTSTTEDIKVTFENTQLGQMSITKIDADTKKPLAGAVLVLKDSTGKVLSKWTTTINAHIIKNLDEGTYTIEEVEAPKGYLLSDKVTTIKVTDDVKNYKVVIENKAKNVVVNINKIDGETKLPLAGSVIVIKDSTGKVIDRFTTTEEPHVITNLENGTYTAEEEEAPEGYVRSTEVITFTVDDNHLSHQIIMINEKEVYVPDTGSDSVIMLLIGAIIIGIGLEYVLKNVKA